MKIALVGPTHPYKGGIAHHTTELARRLQADHDVTLESWDRQYPALLYPGQQVIENPGFDPFPRTHRDLSWNRPDSWMRVGRRIADRSELVLVVVTTPIQVPILLRVLAPARRRHVTVVGIVHNVVPHESHWYDQPLIERLLRRLDGVVVHNPHERGLAERSGARRAVVARLPMFHIPDELLAAPPTSRSGLIGYLGFVRPYKGLDVLIEALALTSSRPRLEIRGEFWDDPERYRRQIRELGLEDRCELVPGFASSCDVDDLLSRSDALVLPYRSGTGSQLPRLSFAARRPVIATDVGDLPSQVRHDVDGLICAPSDPRALADAIDHLYSTGTFERLASNVTTPDPSAEWADYIETITSLCGSVETP